ncbi:MAG TPA: zinc ribbon domain-containing protein [Bryobacteraceae bacterium]|nr:zinc ribbon domain-containing protein [Bryobacteraceae bacterium]
MFCDRCGARLHESARFCPSCGRTIGTIPLMPVRNRTAGHVRLLGILWLALSAFRLIPGTILISLFRRGRFDFLPPDVPFFVNGLVQTIGALILCSAVVGLIAGWGLLDRQPWARMLAIALGCINLIDMPFGTGLGIYTLWVLLPAKSEEEYRQIARVA